jgi:uncharacterized protein YjbJ (UPF0337 family)
LIPAQPANPQSNCLEGVEVHTETKEGMPEMSSPDKPQRTSGGLVGKVAGRAKEAAGAVLNDKELVREGRLQQTKVDAEQEARDRAGEARQREAEAELEREQAETKAERELIENEVQEAAREKAADRDRREAEKLAEERSAKEIARAENEKASAEAQARQIERQAEQNRNAGKAAAAGLNEEARRAEAEADAIDPKENR